jgi:hypothetical protein
MPQFRYARKYRAAASGRSRGTDAVSDVGQTGLDTLHVLGWNRRTQLIQHGICWGSTIVHIHESRADHTESSIDRCADFFVGSGVGSALCAQRTTCGLLAPLAIHHTRLPTSVQLAPGYVGWLSVRPSCSDVRYHSRCSKCWLSV